MEENCNFTHSIVSSLTILKHNISCFEVFQDGWILTKFFFGVCFYGPRRNRTSLANKGFILWPKDYTKEFGFCGNKAGNPERY